MYCPACGQETTVALPTLRVFMREAAGRYVALDGRMWRTLYGLMFRPGFLTREFFAGRRRRYIRPARLFLVLSIVAFATLRFTGTKTIVISDPVVEGESIHLIDPDEPESSSVKPPPARLSKPPAESASGTAARITAPRSSEPQKGRERSTPGNGETPGAAHDVGVSIGSDLDLHLGLADEPGFGALNERVQRFNRLSRREKADAMREGVLRFGPYAMIVLLPLFALLMKIAYLGRARRYPLRPRRYTAHLVYGAHNHAFMVALVTVYALVGVGWIRGLLVSWGVIYLVRSMKTVYDGRWSGVAVRSIFVGFFYFLFFIIAVSGLVVAAALFR